MLPPEVRDVERLGDGAEGGTFVGTEVDSGRRVVLKRVEAERRVVVRHAFAVLRRVASPHLPSPRALLPDREGGLWLVCDHVEGRPLPATRTSALAALAEATAVAHALAAIHEAGTHHGDVSAGNVVVTATGGVVLVDLGQLGRFGTGTPGFLAPEVLGGGGGPAADRFALGSLLALRLFGAVPWMRPEALLSVRSDRDVARRLTELAGDAPLDPPLERLLVALLAPDPARRFADTSALVDHLRRLRDALSHPGATEAVSPWWPVERLAYRGADPAPLVEALSSARPPALVVLAGPPGSGRGRVALELVQALQLRDVPARACDPEALAAVVGLSPQSWYEAWTAPVASGSAAPVGRAIVALTTEPEWPGAAGEPDSARRAALLRAGAALSSRTLVVPTTPAVADDLRDKPGVLVLDVRALDRVELEDLLASAVSESPGAWADALLAVTGGWAGRVASAIRACARAGVSAPEPSRIERALAEDDDGARLDADVARRLLVARWRGDASALEGIAADLHDGERPLRAAVAAARRRLGSGVAELAAVVASETDGPIGLELALDAGDVAAMEAALQQHGAGDRGTLLRVAEWLGSTGRSVPDAPGLSAAARRVVARALLAEGDAAAVLALVDHGVPDPSLHLEAARALQRLGRADEAHARLDAIEAARTIDADLRWAARGLRWRLFVDAGRAADAVAAAEASLPEPAVGEGVGLSTAFLWGAMAQLGVGALERARAWLDTAGALARSADAPDIGARTEQLLGNLALAHGELKAARRHYGAAAEAFARAGEPVGATIVRGSLAALSIPSWSTQVGLEHGRATVRSLLARGDRAAMLEAALNLVQLLSRIDARGEIDRLCRAVTDVFGTDVDAEQGARRARISAERVSVRARAEGGPWASAETAFARAAQRLSAADRGREATEAWLRAAAWARRDGRLVDARRHLGDAAALSAGDPDSEHGRTLEGVAQALARATDRAAVASAAAALARIPPVARLRARGRLDLAWARDRLLLSALRRCEPPRAPARRAAALRLTQTLEAIMSKTAPVDRPAVRAALDAEIGEPGAFAELLDELGQEAAAPAAPRTRPRGRAVEATRRDELLRIYRRLAREDDLQRLLEQVVDAVMDLTDAERGAVVVLATDHTERIEVTRELGQGADGVGFSRSVIERVLGSGDPVLSVDATADDRFDQSRSISHLNLRSVLSVPLRFRGELLGAAYVDHRLRRGNFDEGDLAHMEEFAELAALAVAHARALAASRTQAEALRVQGQELERLLEVREVEAATLRARVQTAAPASHAGMIGHADAMQRVFRLIDRLSDTDVPVVVYGESGTGKELVARAIHDGGARGRGPFVAENCGAIPETLLESVLFGHARGAFTGAHAAKPGLFEAADGGTIFLDEVGEMSPGMQAKLLRVLQEGEVRRVGENRERKVDVRVIAASNRDLDELVAAGRFRSDLFYRINVVKLSLPALRERLDDLPLLVDYFLRRHAPAGRPFTITPAAMRALSRHRWPGNVRELENEVQRWVALSDGVVDVGDLSPMVAPLSDGELDPEDLRIRPRVEHVERELIERALAQTAGNQTRAAELLGLSRFGLQKKLRRMGIGDGE